MLVQFLVDFVRIVAVVHDILDELAAEREIFNEINIQVLRSLSFTGFGVCTIGERS